MSTRRFFFTNAPPAAFAAVPAWFPFLTQDGGGNWQGNFLPGTIGGVLASNYTTALTLTQGQVNYVYAEMTASGGAITAATLAVSTSYPALASPTSGSPPTSFNIPIAVIDLTGSTPNPSNIVGYGNIWCQPYVALLTTESPGTILTAPYAVTYNWEWGAGD